MKSIFFRTPEATQASIDAGTNSYDRVSSRRLKAWLAQATAEELAALKTYIDTADAELIAGALGETIATEADVRAAAAKLARMDVLIPVVKEWDNRRAFAGGVALTTAGEFSVDAGSADFGAGSFALYFSNLHADDWTPASNGELYSTHSTGNNRVQVTILTTGVWRLTFTDNVGSATNYDITPTVAIAGANNIALVFDRAGLATLYVNNTANGTVDISAELDVDIGSGNANKSEFMTDANLSGSLGSLAIFNRAISAAEVTELSDYGLAAIQTSIGFAWDWDWVSWEKGNADAGYTVTSANKQSLTIEKDGTNVFAFAKTATPTTFYKNRVYRVSFDLAVTGSNPGGFTLRLNDDVTGSTSHSTNSTVPWANGSYEFDIVATSDSLLNRGVFAFITGTNTIIASAVITNFRVNGALVAFPMTEGIGRQLHDLSGRYDALLSATGYEHLQPKSSGKLRVKAADASTAMYMLEASDIIPSDAIVSKVLAEERVVAVANTAQLLDDNRIRLNPSGSDLQIQRSDGTNHTTIGTVTAPTALTDVDVEIHYDQVAR